MTTKIIVGDALETLKTLPSESVHCIITSPPYFGLRDYGTAEWEGGDDGCDHVPPKDIDAACVSASTLGGGKDTQRNSEESRSSYRHTCAKCGATRVDKQMGLEETPEEFLANMVEVFREARRVLRADGTCWVNMGDSYATSPPGNTQKSAKKNYDKFPSGPGKRVHGGKGGANANVMNTATASGLKPKNLLGMPWRLALALQQPHLQCNGCDNVAHKSAWGHFPNGRMICPACIKSKGWTVAEQGWWLRSDIIWAKPNPMPESVTDRPTKAHEYVFLLTKSARYFYDAEAVREKHTRPDLQGKSLGWGKVGNDDGMTNYSPGTGIRKYNPAGRNRRTVWTIATQPFSAAHFATFPPALVEPMIKAGTSERGCCPECGGPWKRVTEKDTTLAESRRGNENYKSGGLATGSKFASATPGYSSKVTTTGWQPTCECCQICDIYNNSDHKIVETGEPCQPYAPIPCTALDIFAGAFTVGLVADRLGRDSIMIELNPEYAAMGEQRIKDDAGWVADIEVEETAVTQLELI